MPNAIRLVVLVLLAAIGAVVVTEPLPAAPARPQSRRTPTRQAPTAAAPDIEALPGTVVRWSVPGTKRCGMGGRTWKALGETCYYPIDVAHKPDVVTVSRHGAKSVVRARIRVIEANYGSENILLGDIPQAHPSAADLKRNAREQVQVNRLWRRPERPAQFTLPLGAPLTPMPEGKGFGSRWIFNTTPETTELHNGVDYAAAANSGVAAIADGTVVMAKDLFFSGNSVFIDHGNGLITMYFHLSEIKVRAGEKVQKGSSVGLVGATGRATGPHLHLAVRWHGARIDPRMLLDDPAKIPAIGRQ